MSGNLFEADNGRGALVSACGAYRYRLWRLWNELLPVMVWVMLNPSTADAGVDDPTLRKCIGFAKRHHHGGVIVVNLFAYRSTDPRALRQVADPIGPENDDHIRWACSAPVMATIVAGWGGDPAAQLQGRATVVGVNLHARRPVHCFGKTIGGDPRHPLMLSYSTPLEVLG